MLDMKFLRQNPQAVADGLARRRFPFDLDAFLALEERRRETITEVERKKGQRNAASAEVAKIKRQGGDAAHVLAGLGALSEDIKALDEKTRDVDAAVTELLLGVPNIPHATTPDGANENDNVEIRRVGVPRALDFPAMEHQDVGTGLGGLDFERAAKLSGARFVVLRGGLARLERALAAFMLDTHTLGHGYTEVATPYIVNAESLTGTGQLPKFAEDLFKLDGQAAYLIPTAEVPVTNLHRGEVLPEAALPLAYTCHTQCFRSEAGSYGKDTKGLIRLHQFGKVELVRLVHPDTSYQELEVLTGHAEAILQALGLPYRVVALCAGDLGFSSAKTYDLEVWLPGQDKYREISSCSNFEDFQARRADIRFKPEGGKKTALVHTLNGSGLAIGRTMAAILENYVRKDGSVVVPPVLVPFMGGTEVLEPEGPGRPERKGA
ncbi:seryl-tRNA synthetase [Solidesulfovibrio carbinoliphilus subsp. oakridgensis]|uniref:Serine--tRNA ligase n=1 Tax=Solidesulfovibrio carbinoliphilus subsp. oakridgensis TaxID=694327 RepID=G7Q9F3_9BACT|nr:serine--tRNA ligase [Solidesulfovibrio carbinoliphilus]EHJ48196.1 seryl-tRNA synthetase [Solidesulfovibrio carbinoliphilus subsp. oakridgensis]